ncbi:histidine phosphatase family protein [Paenibacillus chondroitinus]|uniref:Histidine phosphatase family protein n=1 Tax=Paenibacillus chondroitinus TaxID=59842 RepID=A0ABU6DM86_9BACL|nr:MULTISPECIES: histidine phosphatase family protein [Paenibacillus]MCY9661979.1 histidine phosphatase family protein [Paenibacillus anseongense]MEB4798897.1 histidine phosphatase family protein [Paenibacillus chondroitinus]
MMKLGFIRHGVTGWNELGKMQGQTDIPLNQEGKEQAKALATRLASESWDAIFSSDLLRAKETASIIAQTLDIVHVEDPRLRERKSGRIEGTTEEERIRQWGKEWRKIDHGIETNKAVQDRVKEFMNEVASCFEIQNILIVSHGITVGLTLKYLMPYHFVDTHLDNASLTCIQWINSEWACPVYNCTIHLKKRDTHDGLIGDMEGVAL